MAALLAQTPAAGGAQPPVHDAVPVPVGDISDWDGIVGPNSALSVTSGVDSSSGAVAGDHRRLHVKFHEGSAVRFDAGGFVGDAASALGRALAQAPPISVTPLFTGNADAIRAARADGEAKTGRPLPDLTTWWLVELPTAAEGRHLATALRGLVEVEMVQPEPTLALTQAAEERQQGYLDPAIGGIDAEGAWARPGGTGADATIAVIDSGFDTNHPDLDRVSGSGVPISHEAPWDTHHGLQVLAILAADNDFQGLRGIAYDSPIRTVNSGRSSGDVANAINLASRALVAGDVITISQGICAVSGCGDGVVLPLVYSASARDALRSAAGRGVITVVSGGNGGANLDNYRSRLGTDAPDTIVVGAGNPPAVAGCAMEDGPARSRVTTSNYGPRVDLHGWGACVRTAVQGGGYQWWGFTSGATPIVAGAAALVSSMAQAQGTTLTGSQVRSILEATGSPQVASRGSIGPLPNTTSAIGAVGNLPANDNWAGAVELESVPSVLNADMRFAGVQLDEPGVTCGSISHTRWYHFTPDVDMELRFDTSGSDYDTMIGLWRSDGDSLVREDCSDDITVNNPASRFTHRVTAGETYYIQAGGADGASGRLRLVIEAATSAGVGCDIDGDRRGDIVSGSPSEDVDEATNAGRALVHFGRRDGKPRIGVSVTQEWPGISGASERGDAFGEVVVCGDFNGDGHDDIAIGSPREGLSGRRRAGAVRIVEGSESGLRPSAATMTQNTSGISGAPERGDRFGSALAVGDFDGDGFDDLAIGVKGEDTRGVIDAGAVQVVYGSSAGLDPKGVRLIHANTRGVPGRSEPGDRFGATLAAGDLDGDGFSELAVGIPSEDVAGQANAGAVVVFSGGTGGLETRGGANLHQRRAVVEGSPHAGDLFGKALALGDLDGDGDDELIVGVPGEAVGGADAAGQVHIFDGGPDWAALARSTVLHQDVDGVRGEAAEGDRFGAALASGDVDADGWDDLGVGAPGDTVKGVLRAGAVHIFDGSADGVVVTGDQLVHQDRPGVRGRSRADDRFGAALSMVDVNGDARRDLVVGSPGEDLGSNPDAGIITIFPGKPDGVSAARSVRLTQRRPVVGRNEPGDGFGHSLAS
jgi:hypothetical protein